MRTKIDIWMPLYIKDLLADTLHLTTRQFGAYMFLLCHYWEKGSLNPSHIQTVSRLDDISFEKDKDILLSFFDEKNGFLFNKRIEKEIKKSEEFKKSQSRKGRLSAEIRWGQGGNRGYSPVITERVTETQPNCNPAPASLPASIKSIIYTPDFEKFWEQYPRRGSESKMKTFEAWKKAVKVTTKETILEKLDGYKQTKNVKEGYQVQATRWLNERMWEVEAQKKKSLLERISENESTK